MIDPAKIGMSDAEFLEMLEKMAYSMEYYPKPRNDWEYEANEFRSQIMLTIQKLKGK